MDHSGEYGNYMNRRAAEAEPEEDTREAVQNVTYLDQYNMFTEINSYVNKAIEQAKKQLGFGKTQHAELALAFSATESKYCDTILSLWDGTDEAARVFMVASFKYLFYKFFDEDTQGDWFKMDCVLKDGTTMKIGIRNLLADGKHTLCERCGIAHETGKMWYQHFDGREYFVCERCHRTLYFAGWTNDFGIRWWDREVFLKKYPEKDTPEFRAHVAQCEISDLLLNDQIDADDLNCRQ